MSRRIAAVTAVVLALTVGACTASTATRTASAAHRTPSTSTSTSKSAAPTPADQLSWVASATHHLPVASAQATMHFTSSFLTAVGGISTLDKTLTGIGPITVDFTSRHTTQSVTAVTQARSGARFLTVLALDTSGRIATLEFVPYLAAPTSWTQIDTRLRALAPEVSFQTARVSDGSCRPVHTLAADTPRPLGSAFKLYVLGALANAVEHHRVSWTQQLAIREAWKSLPSGELQNDTDGTELTLQRLAAYMISISDNTAADHLIHFLGRPAVEAQLRQFGNAHPGLTTPFPTTRELFTLKGHDYPALANAYLAANPTRRAAMLAATAKVPRSAIGSWTEPEDITSLEWFASAADMCRALAGLQQQSTRPGLAPISTIMSINDGGLGLNPADDPLVWFKGGSEPGVFTLNYLVRDTAGRTIVVSVLLSDPDSPLDEQMVATQALAIIRGAITLAG